MASDRTYDRFKNPEVGIILKNTLRDNLIMVVEGSISKHTAKVFKLMRIVGVRVLKHAVENCKSRDSCNDWPHTGRRVRDRRGAIVSFEVGVFRPGPRYRRLRLVGSFVVVIVDETRPLS